MTIARDEIFGPVQSILKWKDLDEVRPRLRHALLRSYRALRAR